MQVRLFSALTLRPPFPLSSEDILTGIIGKTDHQSLILYCPFYYIVKSLLYEMTCNITSKKMLRNFSKEKEQGVTSVAPVHVFITHPQSTEKIHQCR